MTGEWDPDAELAELLATRARFNRHIDRARITEHARACDACYLTVKLISAQSHRIARLEELPERRRAA